MLIPSPHCGLFTRTLVLDSPKGVPARRIGLMSDVEANYQSAGKGDWRPGKVTRERGDGTFDVVYDDGRSESGIGDNMIRPLDRNSPGHHLIGSKLECEYNAEGEWHKCEVSCVRNFGTYDIFYSHGGIELAVPGNRLRLIEREEPADCKRDDRKTNAHMRKATASTPLPDSRYVHSTMKPENDGNMLLRSHA